MTEICIYYPDSKMVPKARKKKKSTTTLLKHIKNNPSLSHQFPLFLVQNLKNTSSQTVEL